MRLFISGSAPLLIETFNQFRERTGHTILERYGMSETVMLTSNPYHLAEGERRGGTVGFPLPEVKVRVVDDGGQPCPAGTIGNLQVNGPSVFQGYWRMPDKTRGEFAIDDAGRRWFKTGDVGQIDEMGYVTIVGRSKDLIISGGYNVYPAEVEGVLNELPGVAESAVIGVPHPDFGEGVIAVAVARPGSALDPAALIAAAEDAHRPLQGAEAAVRRRRTAAQRDGQGAEEPAARRAPRGVHARRLTPGRGSPARCHSGPSNHGSPRRYAASISSASKPQNSRPSTVDGRHAEDACASAAAVASRSCCLTSAPAGSRRGASRCAQRREPVGVVGVGAAAPDVAQHRLADMAVRRCAGRRAGPGQAQTARAG